MLILDIDSLLLQLIVKYEIDPNSEDKIGNTPAHLAAAEGHLECLKVLVYHRKQPLEVVTCKNNNVSIKHSTYNTGGRVVWPASPLSTSISLSTMNRRGGVGLADRTRGRGDHLSGSVPVCVARAASSVVNFAFSGRKSKGFSSSVSEAGLHRLSHLCRS
jgi:hypothetical protein